MSKWFGKYNNNYAYSNTGLGSSGDYITRKKQRELFTNTFIDVESFTFPTSYNSKSSTFKVDEDAILTYAENHSQLNDITKGRTYANYSCGEYGTEEQCYADGQHIRFNPDNCDPQTFTTANAKENTDCTNNYTGILLVDENCNEVENTCTALVPTYGEVKDSETQPLEYTMYSVRMTTKNPVQL